MKTNHIDKLLMAAVENEHTSACRLFLEKGGDPNYTGEDGLQPLTVAVENGNTELSHLLLDRGADIPLDVREQLGGALRHAIDWDMTDVAMVLLSHGVNIRYACIGEKTVLERSERAGTRGMARLLHAAGKFLHYKAVVHLDIVPDQVLCYDRFVS